MSVEVNREAVAAHDLIKGMRGDSGKSAANSQQQELFKQGVTLLHQSAVKGGGACYEGEESDNQREHWPSP